MSKADFKAQASYSFKRVVQDPRTLNEPVAEFTNAAPFRTQKILRHNMASLESTIKNETANAERYPNSSARANLVQLNKARVAFDTFQKS